MNSKGNREGTTSPGVWISFGSMKPRAEAAVENERPTFEAMLLMVSDPNARSSCSAPTAFALPLSQEDTVSPQAGTFESIQQAAPSAFVDKRQ